MTASDEAPAASIALTTATGTFQCREKAYLMGISESPCSMPVDIRSRGGISAGALHPKSTTVCGPFRAAHRHSETASHLGTAAQAWQAAVLRWVGSDCQQAAQRKKRSRRWAVW